MGLGEGNSGSSQSVVSPMALTSLSLAGSGSASGSTVVSSAPVLAMGLDITVSDLPTCLDLNIGGSCRFQ
jgi:hypothetical protein